ncbi:MAG: low specificity L-threonine aldolase [Okeania sp. SIO3H1]|uniref:threonine aldolase family protein n=1 Tax=Okeania sp. SIO1I7 TaxID=2607772 RepID=UPI0013C75149|nr:low specificity L-threonine aldolase [Okeania sp. SIO1I7]NEN90060.1 low specificity L-threonine aldolase [Okeania sp. SIO3H1]NET25400.1 low specificity L-threonine aldolase [Okeania sp. SIO1I7]
MNFCSDNVTEICPEIMAAITVANEGSAMPYGADEYTQRLEAKFSKFFEAPVTIFPVATGSAANALALSAIAPAYGAIYCHAESHINVDECGAPEFYTGGAKLVTLSGTDAQINPSDLATALEKAGIGIVHHVQPAAVSITQATEAGTVYLPEDIAEIAKLAHVRNLYLHMDGARFANAVASLGCAPADITWRAGVDVLCFGATKNGAMAAEAVVFFNQELAKTFGYRRKRSGHLFSKMRFLSAQLEAYITDDLWLKNASNANQMATKLAQGLVKCPLVRLCHPVEANEIFVEIPESVVTALRADGFEFYVWQEATLPIIRVVTAFNTRDEDVDAFLASVRSHSAVNVTE